MEKQPIPPIKNATEVTPSRPSSRAARIGSAARTQPAGTITDPGQAIFFELTKRVAQLYSCSDYSCSACTEDFQFLQYLSFTNVINEKIVSKFLTLGVVELFQNVWVKSINADIWKPENQTVRENIGSTFSSMVNLTDSSSDICRRVLDIDMHSSIFRVLASDFMSIGTENAEYSDRADMADGLLSILYNVIQAATEAREMYRDHGAVDVFQRFRDNPRFQSLSCLALILQAYVVNEEDNERINSEERSFNFLARELKTAVKRKTHRSEQGYKATELLTAFNKLAVSDKNKGKILKTSVLESYVAFLQNGCTPEEQYAAVDGLWQLAFTCPDDIKKQPGCLKGLQELASTSSDDGVKRQAVGALETLGLQPDGKPTAVVKPVSGDVVRPTEKVVFISYNHGSKGTVLRVRDRLKAAGYKVWIDEDEMCKSIAEDITQGLDRSSVVLVCLSQKYFESSYCKKEVIYADFKQKEIIPLTVEPRYKPDGWLQFRLGDKLRIDFSSEPIFETSFRALIKQISLVLGDTVEGQVTKSNTTETSSVAHTNNHQPPAGNDVRQSKLATVRSWNSPDVHKWFTEQGLSHQLKEKFSGFDGNLLLKCKALREDAPEAFATSLLKQFSFEDVLKLNTALKEL